MYHQLFVTGELAWSAPDEAASNDLAGVVVTDADAIMEEVDTEEVVVAGAFAVFKSLFELARIQSGKTILIGSVMQKLQNKISYI